MESVLFSFLAGLLTTLSPCVLPVLPLIIGVSLQKNRQGPLLVAAGLVTSFTVIGVGISFFNQALGVSSDGIRVVASVLLIVSGLVLISAKAQSFLIRWLSPLSGYAQNKVDKVNQTFGLSGQFFIGLLCGAVWSPCVGPTLGIAIGLASQGESLGYAGTMMFIFSLGAVIPLLIIAYFSQSFFQKRLSTTASVIEKGKKLFGIIAIMTGILLLTGLDKLVETAILNHLPDWWFNLTVLF